MSEQNQTPKLTAEENAEARKTLALLVRTIENFLRRRVEQEEANQ